MRYFTYFIYVGLKIGVIDFCNFMSNSSTSFIKQHILLMAHLTLGKLKEIICNAIPWLIFNSYLHKWHTKCSKLEALVNFKKSLN